MKFDYGGYTSDNNEVLRSPISYTELMSPTGYMYAVEVVHTIPGRIVRSTQNELLTRLGELKTASRIRGGDLTYTTNDGINVGLSLLSSDTIGGVGCSLLSLPQAKAGEMGLYVEYTLRFSAIVPVGASAGSGNPVIEFRESIEGTNPSGGGEFTMVPIEGDRPQRHDTYPFLSSTYLQSGRVVWLRQGPLEPLAAIPPPFSPADVHWSGVRVFRGEAMKWQNGVGLFFPVDYSYPMETREPLPGVAWRPRTSLE